jgi:hypothetical protein
LSSIDSLENILDTYKNSNNSNIIYKLPIVDFNNITNKVIEKLSDTNSSIMITKIAHLTSIKKKKFKSISADYTINLWNKETLALLVSNGINLVTLHPELSFKDSMKILENSKLDIQGIYFGRIPIGYTRACFKYLNICSKACDSNYTELYNINKSYNVAIKCNSDLGVRAIYHKSNFISSTPLNSNSVSKRIILTGWSKTTIDSFIESIKLKKLKLSGEEILIYKKSVK